ncbi:MAG TPA: undecaprenyl-diphosphatase UppP [Thermodesulfovibrionales bacterium]|nr:undecaprenyl-diphosphatase UppP [Thermodesulfovibrionales bacterium]
MDTETLKAAVLGIVQGLTEFLPVSSTAHLVLFPWFFGWGGELDSLSFDVALHGGTLLALLACFYRDWIRIITKERRLLFFIVIASIPAGVAGILLHKAAEHSLRSPVIIAVSLVIVGLVMLLAEKYNRPDKNMEGDRFSLLDSIFIGVAQAIALIPGVSRSGITITAGLFRNLDRESAARFSFLLSMPVIFGATLLEGRKLLKNPAIHGDLFVVGVITSFASGFLAIRFLLRFLKNHPLNVFVYYRFLLAGVIFAAMFFK